MNSAKEKLEIVIRAASPPFGFFAGGLPRRRRRRKWFGLIQVFCSILELVRAHFGKEIPTAKIWKDGEAAPMKTAKELVEKHQLEPYFKRKFFIPLISIIL